MTAAVVFSEPCPQCGGTGLLPVDFETSPEVPYRCPACHSGMVPDDGTVEAAAKVMQLRWESDRDDGEEPYLWDDLADSDRQFWLDWALEILVAAARYQPEVSP